MTKLAIISDIHADYLALVDALTQIERMDCDLIVCAGDLVDYGPYPNEAITLLRDLGIPCVRGNHDRWALHQHKVENHTRRRSLDDGRHRPHATPLSAAAIEILGNSANSWWAEIAGVHVAVHHASPQSDTKGIDPHCISRREACRLLSAAGADVLLCGHTHMPFALHVDHGGLIANPGALLRGTAESLEWRHELDGSSGFGLRTLPAGGTFGVLELPSLAFAVFAAADGAKVSIPRITLEIGEIRDDGLLA